MLVIRYLERLEVSTGVQLTTLNGMSFVSVVQCTSWVQILQGLEEGPQGNCHWRLAAVNLGVLKTTVMFVD